MTARDTYTASVKSALATAVAAKVSNAVVAQTTRDASGCNLGILVATNSTNFAAFDTATRNANAAYYAAQILAEHNKQIAIQNAKDILRGTGDLAPA